MKELKVSNTGFINEIEKHIDFDHITKDEALELGFVRWDESDPDLYLIPLYLFPILPIGSRLRSILGETIIYNGSNVNNDNRFGCIAYGIEIKE